MLGGGAHAHAVKGPRSHRGNMARSLSPGKREDSRLEKASVELKIPLFGVLSSVTQLTTQL